MAASFLSVLAISEEGSAQTWTLRTTTVPPEQLNDAVFTSGNTAAAVGDSDGTDGTIVISSDGGLTWTERSQQEQEARTAT